MKNRTKLMFGIAALILIAASLLIFLICSKGSNTRDLQEIKAEGVLKVVTNYDPVGYYIEDGKEKGFNQELIALLEKESLLKIEVALVSSVNTSIDSLENGRYDVIVRNIPITTTLRDKLNFTIPVIQNRQVLIQRKAEYNNGIKPIRSHLELAEKTIYAPKHSPAILRIQNLSDEIGEDIHCVEDEYYDSEQLAMKVASSEIDYAICDEKLAKKLSTTLPEIDYKTLLGFTHFEAWAVRKDAPILLDSLNTWLGRIKNTKQYNDIYRKYYK